MKISKELWVCFAVTIDFMCLCGLALFVRGLHFVLPLFYTSYLSTQYPIHFVSEVYFYLLIPPSPSHHCYSPHTPPVY